MSVAGAAERSYNRAIFLWFPLDIPDSLEAPMRTPTSKAPLALSVAFFLCAASFAAGQGKSASPLDALDPKKIPALEKFDWQPKELVAVLGEHKGRQGNTVTTVAFHPDGKHVASGGGNGL